MQVEKEINKDNVPYTSDGGKIMICSPVGNQVKYLKQKANIALSGFCTAPAAAIDYLRDDNNDIFKECRHSFNTNRMKIGITKIFQSIGIKNSEEIRDIALSNNLDDEMNFLFTQLLCMISYNSSASAHLVEKVLKTSSIIRDQANHSIKAWYNRINDTLEDNGIILLMGKNAEKLLKATYISDNSTVKIDYFNKLSDRTLFDEIDNKYRLFFIIHASGIAYKKHEANWLKSEYRLGINELLYERFPNKINKLF